MMVDPIEWTSMLFKRWSLQIKPVIVVVLLCSPIVAGIQKKNSRGKQCDGATPWSELKGNIYENQVLDMIYQVSPKEVLKSDKKENGENSLEFVICPVYW